ncbi:RDD family protein [Desulfovibrio sp. OttesenSCG-928-O18]|nr:RDD family protein [Desulfovibrio sp. OttesenSCG-928-O18]
MAIRTDRVGELLEGIKRNRRVILSPEGVPLDVHVAGHGERLTAFALDLTFLFVAVGCLYVLAILLFFSHTNISVGMTLVLFIAFIVRNLYFLHFELAWQGRTPGKRICGLRVINREGGELSPTAVIARNLTREVEVFLPLSLYVGLGSGATWQELTLLGWVLAIVALPFFNRDHLRAGDLIGGTQVISMPKRLLLGDLAAAPAEKNARKYVFTHEQLAVYGAFELQVLEEFLRRPEQETGALLEEVCRKICRKINWEGDIPPHDVRRFLSEFYTAERADLERGQLFGKLREDKTAGKKLAEPQTKEITSNR